MTMPVITTAFTGGEIAPGLWGRVEFAKFAIGASTLRNFYVGFKGGAYSRAGTAFVGYSKQTVNNIATGSIYFPSNPIVNQTITLNGITFTFVAAGATDSNFEFNIGANAGGTISQAVLRLNTSTTYLALFLLNGASYSDSGGGATDDLIVTWKTSGPAGNSYTLAADAPAVVSGATLSGGGSIPPRLIPFQFSLNQGLVLEFGQQYMRVISNGGFVLNDGHAITAITNANPASVTEVAHGYSTGAWVRIVGVVGMPEINFRTFVITVTSANTFTLADVFGNPIDASAYGTYVSGGTGSSLYELATPYDAVDLPFLKFTQSADVMTLCLRNQETGTEYPSYDLGRLADNNWVLTEFSTASPISAPANVVGDATVTSGVGGMTDYQYVVTAVDAATLRESVASNIADIPNSVDISATQGSIELDWDAVSGALYYNIYKAPPAFNSTVPIGSLFGYAGQVFGLSFVDSNIVPDMLQVPPLHKNPFLPGQALSVTITNPGSSLLGPIGFTITPTPSDDPTGYAILVGGEMLAWVFDYAGGGIEAGATITFFDSGGSTATGHIEFSGSGNPTAGQTITLNGRVFTFVAAPGGWPSITTNYQINIGGSLGGTLFFLEQALTSGPTYLADSLLNVATYAAPGTALNITYATSGVAGNSYTLAASAAAPSGGTLTGGTGGTPPTGTLEIGPQTGIYPSVPAYFQQRRVYANTANQPDTYWMSQPGDFKNFDSRIPVIDSDAITGTPWSVQVNGIQFMLPLLGGLIMLTGQAAYQVTGAGGSPTNPQPITPSSQQAVPQAYNGCHFYVPPVQIDYDVYYLQAKGSVIRNLSYNYWINTFTGVDITYLSSHLFNNFNLTAMCWAEEPYKILWAVRDDGVLLSLTNLKPQEVMAWARHDTQGRFVGCVSITEPPVDALYLATQRFFGSEQPFMIERMNDRLWTNVEQGWCVDAALTASQPEPNATLTVSSADGLGQPVSVTNLVGGANYGARTVGVVVDLDKIGTGCTSVLTITGGAITAVSLSGGAEYKRPVIQFIDPDRGGAGASATIVLSNVVTLTADSGVFVIGDIGKVIRCGGGVIQITGYTNFQTVTGQVVSPITEIIPNTDPVGVPPFDPGEWSMTRPATLLRNLFHLIGQTVTGLADGNVIPPTVVSTDGTITLDNPASAIVVGLGFQSQIQSLYVEGGRDTAQGRRKNVTSVSVLLEASGDMELGGNQPDGSAQSPQRVQTKWTGMAPASTSQPGLAQRPYGDAVILGTNVVRPVPLYTGYVKAPIGGGFEKPGQAAVQQNQPLPVNILDFVRDLEMGDTPQSGRNNDAA